MKQKNFNKKSPNRYFSSFKDLKLDTGKSEPSGDLMTRYGEFM